VLIGAKGPHRTACCRIRTQGATAGDGQADEAARRKRAAAEAATLNDRGADPFGQAVYHPHGDSSCWARLPRLGRSRAAGLPSHACRTRAAQRRRVTRHELRRMICRRTRQPSQHDDIAMRVVDRCPERIGPRSSACAASGCLPASALPASSAWPVSPAVAALRPDCGSKPSDVAPCADRTGGKLARAPDCRRARWRRCGCRAGQARQPALRCRRAAASACEIEQHRPA